MGAATAPRRCCGSRRQNSAFWEEDTGQTRGSPTSAAGSGEGAPSAGEERKGWAFANSGDCRGNGTSRPQNPGPGGPRRAKGPRPGRGRGVRGGGRFAYGLAHSRQPGSCGRSKSAETYSLLRCTEGVGAQTHACPAAAGGPAAGRWQGKQRVRELKSRRHHEGPSDLGGMGTSRLVSLCLPCPCCTVHFNLAVKEPLCQI